MKGTVRHWQIRIFSVTWIAYAAYYLCRKNFSVMMPFLVSEAAFTNGDLANAIFLYSLAYSAGQFVMGSLADHWGARLIVFCGMMLSAAATGALAAFPFLAGFLILQTVNGFAQAGGWSGLLKIMACWFERRTRGIVMAWWSTNYVIGGFIATLVATYLVTGPLFTSLGWKRGAILPGALLALLAAGYWIFVKESPGKVGLDPIDEETPGEVRAASGGYRGLISNRPLQTIAATYFFIKLTRYAFLFWLPLYMVQQLRYSPAEAGYTSSVYELVGFTGVVGAGYLSDRLWNSRRFPVGAMMMGGLALALLIHPTLSASGRWGNIIGIGLIGIMTYGPDTLMGGTAVQDVVPHALAATAGGYVNGVGSIGQLISPYLVAFVTKQYGWDALFYLLVVFALAGALLLITQWSHRTIRTVLPTELQEA